MLKQSSKFETQIENQNFDSNLAFSNKRSIFFSQMESKLVKSKYTNSTNKKALIIYENANNLNFLYRNLLQSNGYQVHFSANLSNASGNVLTFCQKVFGCFSVFLQKE